MAQINFKGKTFVQNHHLAVKFHQLIPKKDKSVTDNLSLSDNLIVHGDNLKALKALIPTYAGKIKCIYIDPPYNTGNEGWVYSDNVNSPLIQEWLKENKPVDLEDLTRHDKWLCMMMPRLKLLKELLSDDGVVFLSIDDNELYNLKMLCDDVFGETNFVANFIWKCKHGGGGDSPFIVKEHEYVLFYSKDISKLNKLFAHPNVGYEKMFRFQDKKGKYYLERLDKKGIDQNRPNLIYPIECPDGTQKDISPMTWRLSKQELERRTKAGLVEFKKDKKGVWQIYTKMYLIGEDGESRKVKPRSILRQETVGFTQDGNKEIAELFGKDKFQNPKSLRLIKYLLDIVTDKNSGDIILDSFAGTGTTGHAVLDLNKEDGGSRKFILVEMEDYADSITAERVRRVIKNGTPGTFSYFELGEAVELENILSGKSLPSYIDLARYVYYTATGEDFNESQIDENANYIGTSKEYDVFLFYKPDIDYLKSTALTLDRAEKLQGKSGKKKLVFAPTKYIDQDNLDRLNISFAQLPFEIYKLAK